MEADTSKLWKLTPANTHKHTHTHTCIIMEEVMIGEIPNSIRVPRLEAMITRSQ